MANAAIVPAGTNGAVSVYATNDTDLVGDIDGYFAPITPEVCRCMPLRPAA